MRTRSSLIALLAGVFFLLEIIFVSVAEARGGGGGGRGGGGGGRGGGGGFSRSSPASGGSFSSSRPASRPSTRPAVSQRPVQSAPRPVASHRPAQLPAGSGDRQENRQERREERRENLDQAHDNGHDDHDDDHWDDHHYYYSGYGYSDVVVVGTTTETVYVETLPCDYATVVVNGGVQYYRCDDTWYRRGYEGGTVVYIAGSPPPGN